MFLYILLIGIVAESNVQWDPDGVYPNRTSQFWSELRSIPHLKSFAAVQLPDNFGQRVLPSTLLARLVSQSNEMLKQAKDTNKSKSISKSKSKSRSMHPLEEGMCLK
jgi:hypothetical protein